MRLAGCDVEQIARHVHAQRRSLAQAHKAQTPEPVRTAIIQRTLATYGDATGPSIEFLRNTGKSWEDIIDGATRTGNVAFLNCSKPTSSGS